jgi:hypothetical protein
MRVEMRWDPSKGLKGPYDSNFPISITYSYKMLQLINSIFFPSFLAPKIVDKFDKDTEAAAKKLPLLPQEVIDDILLRSGDVDLAYSLGSMSIMKQMTPSKYTEAMGINYIMGVYNLITDDTEGIEELVLKAIESRPVNIVDWAAASGSFRFIKYLSETMKLVGTTDAMDSAAFHGDFDIVEFLHNNSKSGCTTNAMDFAARFGHLDIVIFLDENRIEGCTTKAMDYAAANGHFEVLKLLQEHRTEGCTVDALNLATYNDYD